MVDLALVLIPIALVDSTSMIPLCIVLLVVLLSGPKPLFRSSALLAGIFVTYTVCGFLILYGLHAVFDVLNAYLLRLWKAPNTVELVVQILIGVVLVVFGLRMMRPRKAPAADQTPASMTAGQALLAGGVLVIVGMPGAVPYLAAIDLILRHDPTALQEAGLLVFYNVVFVAPLAAIVVVRQLLGARSQGFLDRVRGFFDQWGKRVVVALMLALGALLIADGIGWFLGMPLIPV